MNKRIRIKREKINNTNRINDILKQLNYIVEKKVFGSGYFIFSFALNSVCWFWLKEFKGWKFGIWLNEKGTFDIFGEYILLIDKFKPSASYVSFDNINDFNEDLKSILNKDTKHLEYLDSIEEEIKNDKEKRQYLFDLTNDIYDYIKEFNFKYKNKYILELKDYGSCRSPRYEIFIKYYDKYELTKDDEYNLYLDLSKIREKSYNQEKEDNWLGETFLICFSFIYKDLLTENEFNSRKKRFNWQSDNTRDFETYIKGLD